MVLRDLVGVAAAAVALVALWAYFRPRVQGSKRPSVWVLVCAGGSAALAVSVAFGRPPVASVFLLLVFVLLNWDELRNGLRPSNHGDG